MASGRASEVLGLRGLLSVCGSTRFAPGLGSDPAAVSGATTGVGRRRAGPPVRADAAPGMSQMSRNATSPRLKTRDRPLAELHRAHWLLRQAPGRRCFRSGCRFGCRPLGALNPHVGCGLAHLVAALLDCRAAATRGALSCCGLKLSDCRTVALSHCRAATVRGRGALLVDKAPGSTGCKPRSR
jgi:hypothetical protein